MGGGRWAGVVVGAISNLTCGYYVNELFPENNIFLRLFVIKIFICMLSRLVKYEIACLDKINGKPRPSLPESQRWENAAFLPIARLYPWFGGKGVFILSKIVAMAEHDTKSGCLEVRSLFQGSEPQGMNDNDDVFKGTMSWLSCSLFLIPNCQLLFKTFLRA